MFIHYLRPFVLAVKNVIQTLLTASLVSTKKPDLLFDQDFTGNFCLTILKHKHVDTGTESGKVQGL